MLLNNFFSILNKKYIFFNSSFFSVSGQVWFGVDINKENVADNLEACVWEPPIIKINALQAACEASCMILSVDETIKSPQSGGEPQMPQMGRGMGRPMM